MRPTIKDIAKKAGVSVTTVSLALNGKGDALSDATVQKVIAVAAELNYSPNQMAVGLITKKTMTFGLLVPDICNMFFSSIAKGAEEQSQKSGYNIIFCNTNDNPQKDIEYTKVMLNRSVDGIILIMSANSYGNSALECYKLIEKSKTPIVLVDRTADEFSAPSVMVDNELGGYLATRHLLDLGHKKIGCITGPMSTQSSKQRFYGYIRALQEYNIIFDPSLIEEGEFHAESGIQLSAKLIDKQVSAIFAFNDMVAYGVYIQAAKRGMKIPADLSIVGFDDTEFSEIMQVPLTTVQQPGFEIGQTAVRKLVDMISQPDQPVESTIFRPKLILRGSTCQYATKQ